MGPLRTMIQGMIQGITEFLPLSSSGHLEIAQEVMGGRTVDSRFFLEFVNFGSFLALVIFYRRKIVEILRDFFKKHKYNYLLNLIVTTIPVAVAGLIFANQTDFLSTHSLAITMITFFLIGLMLINLKRLPRLDSLKNEDSLKISHALVIGLAQVSALIPGVSRVAITVIVGYMCGLSLRSAFRYSLIAGIPVLFGVVFRTLLFEYNLQYISENLPSILSANILAFFIGYAILRLIDKGFCNKRNLYLMGWYRVIVAAVILIFILIQ